MRRTTSSRARNESAPAASGRVPPPTSSTKSSKGGVSFDQEGMMSLGKGLANASATTKPDHR